MSNDVSFQVLPNFPSHLPSPGSSVPGTPLPLVSAADGVVLLPARSRVIVPTGLSMALPNGYEAQIRTDGDLAAEAGVVVLNSPGTIDADYRGEVGVILYNHGDAAFEIARGSRVAWMTIHRYVQVAFVDQGTLPASSRGSGGFGSTGHS